MDIGHGTWDTKTQDMGHRIPMNMSMAMLMAMNRAIAVWALHDTYGTYGTIGAYGTYGTYGTTGHWTGR